MGLAFLCSLPLLWAAFRFGQRETAFALLPLAGVAIWGAEHGLSAGLLSPPFVLVEVQAYLGITAVVSLAIAAEVAERRAQRRALALQKETLAEYLGILDLAHILVLDTNHRITYWTAGAAKLYGFTQADALGKPAHELLQTRFPEPYEQIRARLFAEGRWSGELEQTTWDGRRIVVASDWVLRRDKNGAPTAILEANNDIAGTWLDSHRVITGPRHKD